ncbi:hypothetical protein [Tabrizicola piscis]|nr:hypothetical protein [Tabrizicola piscis]
MKLAKELRITSQLARKKAMICSRNTKTEEMHAEIVPVNCKSDY